jgi:hypothetical protein
VGSHEGVPPNSYQVGYICQVGAVPVQVGSHEAVPPNSYQVGSGGGGPPEVMSPRCSLTLEEPVSMGTLTCINNSLFMGT